MGAVTNTAVCNLALLRLGITVPLNNVQTDNSKEASTCRTLLDKVRRSTLALHGWQGAQKAAALAVNSSITPIFWTYAYDMPSDYVRLLTVHPSDDPNATMQYEVQFQAGYGVKLLCDSTTAYIKYVFDQSDLSQMGDGFINMFSFMLARDLAQPLGKSAALKDLTQKDMRRELQISKSLEGQQKYPQQMASGSWVKARHGIYTDQTIIEN